MIVSLWLICSDLVKFIYRFRKFSYIIVFAAIVAAAAAASTFCVSFSVHFSFFFSLFLSHTHTHTRTTEIIKTYYKWHCESWNEQQRKERNRKRNRLCSGDKLFDDEPRILIGGNIVNVRIAHQQQSNGFSLLSPLISSFLFIYRVLSLYTSLILHTPPPLHLSLSLFMFAHSHSQYSDTRWCRWITASTFCHLWICR